MPVLHVKFMPRDHKVVLTVLVDKAVDKHLRLAPIWRNDRRKTEALGHRLDAPSAIWDHKFRGGCSVLRRQTIGNPPGLVDSALVDALRAAYHARD